MGRGQSFLDITKEHSCTNTEIREEGKVRIRVGAGLFHLKIQRMEVVGQKLSEERTIETFQSHTDMATITMEEEKETLQPFLNEGSNLL